VVVDEAWLLLRDGEGARFLFRMSKAARKRNAGLPGVPQDASDVLGTDLGQGVVANAATQMLRRAPQAIDTPSATNSGAPRSRRSISGKSGLKARDPAKQVPGHDGDLSLASDPHPVLRHELVGALLLRCEATGTGGHVDQSCRPILGEGWNGLSEIGSSTTAAMRPPTVRGRVLQSDAARAW
jgi:hypothetical protein